MTEAGRSHHVSAALRLPSEGGGALPTSIHNTLLRQKRGMPMGIPLTISSTRSAIWLK